MNEFDRNLLFSTAKCVLALYGAVAPGSPVAEELEASIEAWEDNAWREAAERDRLLCERDAVRKKWGEDG